MAAVEDTEGPVMERLWRERFGQPPPIRAEPELMRAILEASEADNLGDLSPAA